MINATMHDEPAFPIVNGIESLADGMSLWDYFAAHALTGICSQRLVITGTSLAEMAATAADAMMAERKKRVESLLDQTAEHRCTDLPCFHESHLHSEGTK